MNDKDRSLCRAAWYHHQNIHSPKQVLSQEALVTLLYDLDTSRTDCCNSVLCDISKRNTNHLQRILKTSLRIISASKYDHVTLIVQKRHSITVKQRIHFTVLLTTYKAISLNAPEYLCHFLSSKWSFSAFRSSNQLLQNVSEV